MGIIFVLIVIFGCSCSKQEQPNMVNVATDTFKVEATSITAGLTETEPTDDENIDTNSNRYESNLSSHDVINDTSKAQDGIEDSSNIDDREVYYHFIQYELVPQYELAGIESISTVVYSDNDPAWFNPGGIVSAYIDDLDQDNKEELLVFYFKENKSSNTEGNVYSDFDLVAAVYKVRNGSLYKIDETNVHAYNGRSVSIASNTWNKDALFISSVIADNKKLIVIEFTEKSLGFAELHFFNYWAMELRDDQLQYVFSFTQTDDARTDFGPEFVGYRFENGVIKSEEIIEISRDFETIKKQFFNSVGIDVLFDGNDDVSILQGDFEKILTYQFHGKRVYIDETTMSINITRSIQDFTELRTKIMSG